MLQTRFTEITGIQWPIIQAPMIGGYSSPEMVSAVSNLGCLGTLALGNSTPENIEQQCLSTLKLTDKPFAANLFVNQNLKVPCIEEKSKAIKVLQPIYEELGIDSAFLYQKVMNLPLDLNTQIEAVISLQVPIITFTFGIPDENIIKKLRKKNIVLIGTATNLTEAARIQSKGFDAVILQGLGAGGHRASFLHDGANGPSTFLLNQQSSNLITIPKVVTGGIINGQQIANYIGQGADGCQLGSAYLFTNEAKLEDYYIDALQNDQYSTCLTNSFTGKYARVINNKFTKKMKDKIVLNFPFQGQLTTDIRVKAAKINEFEILPFWVGESKYNTQRQSTECLTRQLIDQLQVALSH